MLQVHLQKRGSLIRCIRRIEVSERKRSGQELSQACTNVVDQSKTNVSSLKNPKKPSKVLEEFPVVMRLGETPVPIPNTMVKTQEADGTALETMWKSRWLPDQKSK